MVLYIILVGHPLDVNVCKLWLVNAVLREIGQYVNQLKLERHYHNVELGGRFPLFRSQYLMLHAAFLVDKHILFLNDREEVIGWLDPIKLLDVLDYNCGADKGVVVREKYLEHKFIPPTLTHVVRQEYLEMLRKSGASLL